MTFGMEKLEWFGLVGCQTVKNVKDTFIHFHMIHEHDRQTDTA